MISLYDATLTDLLRNDFSHDPEALSFAYAILQEKRRLIDLAKGTRTLAVIDELPEHILDLLSVELRTPFYDEQFPIETKRDLIKRTFIFYQYMGTPEAVNQMVSAAFPGSYIEEWFFYGGEPYHFQVIVEMSQYRQAANATEILRAVDKCKRLSAHCDGIIYQCQIGIIIGTHAHGYKYKSAFTGKRQCGTVPQRSTKSGLGHAEMEVAPGEDSFRYHADLAGTKPYRSVRAGIGTGAVEIAPKADSFKYQTDSTGTKPRRNTLAGKGEGAVEIVPAAQGYANSSSFSGQTETGTRPRRNTATGLQDAAIGVRAAAEGYRFTATDTGKAEAGTRPQRAVRGGAGAGEVTVEAEASGYAYSVPKAGKRDSGTVPDRNTKGGDEPGAFCADADAEGYHYNVKMCGRFFCNNRRGEARL